MTATGVLDLIYHALALAKDARIHDVTNDTDGEILLTTDEGGQKQAWVLAADALVETDPVG